LRLSRPCLEFRTARLSFSPLRVPLEHIR
jgi:hypothetical protein